HHTNVLRGNRARSKLRCTEISETPSAAIRHRRAIGAGLGAQRACGAGVESGWRGPEPAHLTNERPPRARSERSEDHPLDDTPCATEALRAKARADRYTSTRPDEHQSAHIAFRRRTPEGRKKTSGRRVLRSDR